MVVRERSRIPQVIDLADVRLRIDEQRGDHPCNVSTATGCWIVALSLLVRARSLPPVDVKLCVEHPVPNRPTPFASRRALQCCVGGAHVEVAPGVPDQFICRATRRSIRISKSRAEPHRHATGGAACVWHSSCRWTGGLGRDLRRSRETGAS